MGMLGAMAGAGRGISEYSVMLGDQRKLDWKAKQDEVAHNRQVALEDLKNTNANNRQDQLFDRQQENKVEQRAYDESQQIKGVGAGGIEITKAEYDKLSPEEQKLVKSKGLYDEERALGLVEKKFKLTQELEDGVTKETMEKLHASEAYKNAPPALQDLADLEMTVSGKLNLMTLIPQDTSGKVKAPSAEHLKLAMETMSTEDAFVNQKPSVRLAVATVAATKMANPTMQGASERDVPEADWATTAQDVADGKVNAYDLSTISVESFNGILEELAKIDRSTEEKGKGFSMDIGQAAQMGGMMMGPGTKQYGLGAEESNIEPTPIDFGKLWSKMPFVETHRRNKRYIQGAKP